eukprot:6153842-Pyramimonas_sp.AAC.1
MRVSVWVCVCLCARAALAPPRFAPPPLSSFWRSARAEWLECREWLGGVVGVEWLEWREPASLSGYRTGISVYRTSG